MYLQYRQQGCACFTVAGASSTHYGLRLDVTRVAANVASAAVRLTAYTPANCACHRGRCSALMDVLYNTLAYRYIIYIQLYVIIII